MPLVGAPAEGEVDDTVRGFLDHALTSHNSSTNDEEKILVSITKVVKQVVAGMKYTVELVAEGVETKQRYSCQTVLVSQPWIKPEPDVISFTATPIN